MNGARYTQAEDDLIVMLVNKGTSNAVIAAATGRTRGAISDRAAVLRAEGRVGLRGIGRPAGCEEVWTEDKQRAADRKMVRALAEAFQRGDHLPAMGRAA